MQTTLNSEFPVGRFAPTPSGTLHVGNVFTAMIAYLSAKSRGGECLLRIEDLDRARCPKENADEIRRTLEILGFEFDRDVIFQSDRTEIYREYEEKLAGKGLLYPCFCTRAELHAAEAPRADDGNYIYDGKCADLSETEIRELSARRKPCVRVRVPDREITFDDMCVGKYSQNLKRDCGDFIIRRSDGVYAYQLAVTADDALSGVTEVVRGRDLLSSTPRQIWLHETLGFKPPEFAHVPLVTGEDGRKLSKRYGDGDTLSELLKVRSPEQIIGSLAFKAGIIDRNESASLKDLLPLFLYFFEKK